MHRIVVLVDCVILDKQDIVMHLGFKLVTIYLRFAEFRFVFYSNWMDSNTSWIMWTCYGWRYARTCAIVKHRNAYSANNKWKGVWEAGWWSRFDSDQFPNELKKKRLKNKAKHNLFKTVMASVAWIFSIRFGPFSFVQFAFIIYECCARRRSWKLYAECYHSQNASLVCKRSFFRFLSLFLLLIVARMFFKQMAIRIVWSNLHFHLDIFHSYF